MEMLEIALTDQPVVGLKGQQMKNGLLEMTLGFVAVAAALLTSGCRKGGDDAAWWNGEQQRLELAHDLELKEYRYQRADSGSIQELEQLQVSNESNRKRLVDLSRKQTTLTAEVDSMESQLLAVGEQWVTKQRQMAIGKKFKEFPVADGRTFKNATVAAVDDAGVTIRHEDGSARLSYADLDDRQRLFFALDENASIAAQEEEKRQASAYEQWIDSTVAANQAKDERASLEARREEQRIRSERSLIAARQMSDSGTRALGQPARSFGSGYSGGYGSYSSYSRPSYHYVYYNNYNPYGYNPYANRNYPSCYQSMARTLPRNPTPSQTTSFANTTIPYIP